MLNITSKMKGDLIDHIGYRGYIQKNVTEMG